MCEIEDKYNRNSPLICLIFKFMRVDIGPKKMIYIYDINTNKLKVINKRTTLEIFFLYFNYIS